MMLIALKLALRRLRKTPGFTFTALTSLAICIGANLTIFAIVDAILVRPLPFPAPDRLVAVNNSYPGLGAERRGASIPNYFDRRHAIKAFESVSIYKESSVIVGEAGSPKRVPITLVTPEFFTTLGVTLALGQTFTEAHLSTGDDDVAIITVGFWRSYFDSDPHVLGRKFVNDGISVTVMGVLPREFRYLSSSAQFYRPAAAAASDRQSSNRHNNGSNMMVARLAPGVTIPEAQAQMDAFNQQQGIDDPNAPIIKNTGFHTIITGLHSDEVRSVGPILKLLECGALLLLVIGSINLANLLLIRMSGRTKEVAIRRALGARRLYLIFDEMMEATLLAFGGGVGGLFLGKFGIDVVRALGTDKLPLGASMALDGRLALAALLATIIVSLLFAVPIVALNLCTKVAVGLQAETRGGLSSRRTQRLRHVFVIAQVGLAFVLLSGAGLLSVSLARLLKTSTGFNPNNILAGNLVLPRKNYSTDSSRLAFVERILPAIRSLPGVMQVAINTGLPFNGPSSDTAIAVEGFEATPHESLRTHYRSAITNDYWPLMGIQLLRGRLLDDADNNRKPSVCVVDQAFAEHYWPGGNAIGQRLAHAAYFRACPKNAIG